MSRYNKNMFERKLDVNNIFSYRTLIVYFFIIFAWLIPINTNASSPSTIEDLLDLYRSDHSPADFIVLVDTSSSMKGNRFTAVRNALDALVDALTPGDYLAVIGFDKTPHDIISRHTIGVNESSSLHMAVKKCPEPSAVPAKGDWGASDLGSGIEKVLSELSRPKANNVQFLFILSDGNHQPAKDTKYPPDNEYVWDKLAQSAQAITKDNKVEIQWLWFDKDTSSDRIQTVFPDALPIILSSNALKSHFERFRDDIRISKLKVQVANEIANQPLASQLKIKKPGIKPGGTCHVSLYAKSNYKHLPITIILNKKSYPLNVNSNAEIKLLAQNQIVPEANIELFDLEINYKNVAVLTQVLSCFIGSSILPPINEDVRIPITYTVQPESVLIALDPRLNITGDMELIYKVQIPVNPPFPVFATWFLLILVGLIWFIVDLQNKGKIKILPPKFNIRMKFNFPGRR